MEAQHLTWNLLMQYGALVNFTHPRSSATDFFYFSSINPSQRWLGFQAFNANPIKRWLTLATLFTSSNILLNNSSSSQIRDRLDSLLMILRSQLCNSAKNLISIVWLLIVTRLNWLWLMGLWVLILIVVILSTFMFNLCLVAVKIESKHWICLHLEDGVGEGGKVIADIRF